MKLVSWNLNSIRARQERLLPWLEQETPDIVCLQELRATSEEFPHDGIRALGFEAIVNGQKGRNGVAILTRDRPERVERGMGAEDPDPQARLVSAWISGIRVLSVYAPSGQSVGSADFEYKLDWLDRLREHLQTTADPEDPLILAGDFNVAPGERDVANPILWGGSVLCDPAARDALERIREWGLVDVVERHHPDGGVYTWWDYQMRAFDRNDGLRIDHILATAPLAERCVEAWVDREERAGAKPVPPSDHAPVVAEFEI